MLPVVILPARMAFKIDKVVASTEGQKWVVFATYIAYSKDDRENFPKRHSRGPPPEHAELVVLPDSDSE